MTIRIAMWSGPRNLSTALMRSWENRPDTVVLDEPLYAHYLAATGLDHPGREEIIAAGPSDGEEAIGRCLAPLPTGASVSYQKHMSHHLVGDLGDGWLDELRHLLLLRHPVLVLRSYTRVRSQVTLDDLGLTQQLDLAERAELIIDAADFLTDPESYLRAICEQLGLAFSGRMLRWPPGPRDSDGVWAHHWYGSVAASTAFDAKSTADASTLVETLPPHLQTLAGEAVAIYDQLASRRLLL